MKAAGQLLVIEVIYPEILEMYHNQHCTKPM
jgi:hypothetical protein